MLHILTKLLYIACVLIIECLRTSRPEKENKKQNTTKKKNYFAKERKSSGFEKYHHKIFQSGHTAAISILFTADVIGPYAHWPRPPFLPLRIHHHLHPLLKIQSAMAVSFTKKSFFGLSSSSRLFSRHQ